MKQFYSHGNEWNQGIPVRLGGAAWSKVAGNEGHQRTECHDPILEARFG
jgi:hypothetical protein